MTIYSQLFRNAGKWFRCVELATGKIPCMHLEQSNPLRNFENLSKLSRVCINDVFHKHMTKKKAGIWSVFFFALILEIRGMDARKNLHTSPFKCIIQELTNNNKHMKEGNHETKNHQHRSDRPR